MKGLDLQTDNHLGFMFRRISVSGTSLAYWLTVPEFRNEILRVISSGATVDNKFVYDTMKNIYSRYETLRENSVEKPEFNYRLARSGINQIERALRN